MSTLHEPTAVPTPSLDTPVPLSLPAILQNPKNPISAHLHQPQRSHRSVPGSSQKPSTKRIEGRRARLRRENDTFAFNPQAHPPTRSEISNLLLPVAQPTFPNPLPPSLLPRTRPAPSPAPPTNDPRSESAGQFHSSLTGVRRQLRSKGARAESLVKLVEEEIVNWVKEVRQSVVLMPSRTRGRRVVDDFLVEGHEGPAGGKTMAIVEVQRGSNSLVWEIGASFERFVVHCVARHHLLLSFSKPTPTGLRQTHILLPPSRQRSRPPPGVGLDTPPTTDMSSINGSGTDTDAPPAAGVGGGSYGGHWGSWDSESESEGPPLAGRLGPLLQTLSLNSSSAREFHAESVETESVSHEEDTSDDESISSHALSSLSNSLADLSTGARQAHESLLPHRPQRPSFVPTPVGEEESEAEGDEGDRTFTAGSVGEALLERGGGLDVQAGADQPAKATPRSETVSFWEYVYA